MKIKVISLRNSARRRDSIRRQFEKLETPFEFFDAITPGDARHHVRGYDRREFFRNCGRYATETEIACYASHLVLWRRCADEGLPYLILEDDARLDSTFQAGFLAATSQIRKLGFIRVSLPRIKTPLLIGHLGPFDIQYCRRAPLLALGYAIAPLSAKRLAHAAAIVEEPVDKFVQRFWHHGQPIFALTPPFVSLADVADESDIGTRSRSQFGARVWLVRAPRKIRNSILRTAYNVRFVQSLSR